jgi:hypothetical protein
VCWSCWGAAPCSRCCDDARAAAMMRALPFPRLTQAPLLHVHSCDVRVPTPGQH